jgi:hypothetical protein
VKKRLLSLYLMLASAPAVAASPTCRPTLKVAQIAGGIPAGYSAFADGNPPTAMSAQPTPLPIDTIMFSEGPPAEQGWLTPDARHDLAVEWHFAMAQDRNVWISCAYQSTTLMISKPLPPGIKTCRVHSVKDNAGSPTLLCDEQP